ncbi:hypothetical protein NDU88_003530 [Pleurodeles waltl]|uniref:Uncharacterized protein n=1 Tax=Pleurodeles waltl TaxID=8319 RepID=A0AAV7NIC8_PLEWA|nr:hypothetical protein NDU88_003530 [Pleurodeles waltl]
MPGSKSSNKNSGKPARQLLFSEALLQSKVLPPAPAVLPPTRHHVMVGSALESTMDRILQEISAVARRLEWLDSAMISWTADTKSRILGIEQRVTTIETQVASSQDRDQELLFLRSKMTDFEDRSQRDSV